MKEYDSPWVSFNLGNRLFGIQSSYVMEMLLLPSLSQLPKTAEYVRGVVNLRGMVVLVVDLRRKLRMKTAAQEVDDLVELLTKREADHHRWIDELELSVKEKRDFNLTTNPHACAFGKWYDTYKATNVILENQLRKFDAPHQRIHKLGAEVIELGKKGKWEEALRNVEREKSLTLSQLISLFAEAKKLLRETLREIVVVLEHEEKRVGITVDTIDSVEYLKKGSIDDIPGLAAHLKGGIASKTGKTLKGERVVMLIDGHKLINDAQLEEEAPSLTVPAS